MKPLSRFIPPLLLVVLSFGLFVWGGWLFADIFRNTGTSLIGPGNHPLRIDKPGTYRLWTETRAIHNGELSVFPSDLPAGGSVRITGADDTQPLPVRSDTTPTMRLGENTRVSVGTFDFEQAGDYRIALNGFDEPRAFYFDRDKFPRNLFKLLALGGSGLLCLLAGAVTAILIALKKPFPSANGSTITPT